MENPTTTATLTLFSIRADFMGCEYGSLFIVAAEDESEASELVRARVDCPSTMIESCHPIGTTDLFDDPMVVEQFVK